MAAEHIELKPEQQFTKSESGHFGEVYKEVYQPGSGLLARDVQYTPQQWSGLQHDLEGRSGRDGRIDPGPYNHEFLEMAFHGDIYSLGKDTKTLQIDGKPVETGSPQYKEAIAKMESAEKQINFDAPLNGGASVKGTWESLDQK